MPGLPPRRSLRSGSIHPGTRSAAGPLSTRAQACPSVPTPPCPSVRLSARARASPTLPSPGPAPALAPTAATGPTVNTRPPRARGSSREEAPRAALLRQAPAEGRRGAASPGGAHGSASGRPGPASLGGWAWRRCYLREANDAGSEACGTRSGQPAICASLPGKPQAAGAEAAPAPCHTPSPVWDPVLALHHPRPAGRAYGEGQRGILGAEVEGVLRGSCQNLARA